MRAEVDAKKYLYRYQREAITHASLATMAIVNVSFQQNKCILELDNNSITCLF